ncbi:hypothetical protein ABIB75_001525 [Bradyrhizobium sp. GM2.2]
MTTDVRDSLRIKFWPSVWNHAAHDRTLSRPISVGTYTAGPSFEREAETTADVLKELETAAFGYLRERLYSEQRVARSDATCAVLVPASGGLLLLKACQGPSFPYL